MSILSPRQEPLAIYSMPHTRTVGAQTVVHTHNQNRQAVVQHKNPPKKEWTFDLPPHQAMKFYQQEFRGTPMVIPLLMLRMAPPHLTATTSIDCSGYLLHHFNTHSFRIGSATSMAAMGLQAGRSSDFVVGRAMSSRLTISTPIN